jgi:hypothetical protein
MSLKGYDWVTKKEFWGLTDVAYLAWRWPIPNLSTNIELLIWGGGLTLFLKTKVTFCKKFLYDLIIINIRTVIKLF